MSLTFDSGNLMLNDSEIEALGDGPVRWAQNKAGQRMNIDQFVRDLEEQVNKCGFTCQVKVYDFAIEDEVQEDAYLFEVELTGRTGLRVFDPDQMIYEVTRNTLNLPGQQTGFIPTKDAAARLLARDVKKKHRH